MDRDDLITTPKGLTMPVATLVGLHRRELLDTVRVATALLRVMPPRVSAKQQIAILALAGYGGEITLADLAKQVGNDAAGEPILNKNVLQSFGTFIELGWVEQTFSEQDRRKRVIRLTEEGQKVLAKMVAEILDL